MTSLELGSGHREPVPTRVIGWTVVILLGLWAVDGLLLRTDILNPIRGYRPVTPLYAVWLPGVRSAACLFLAVASCVVLWGPRIGSPAMISGPLFAGALTVIGAALPLALFAVREPLINLGSQFEFYREEEFWQDALRIIDLRQYLAVHSEILPELSTHGQHFPPGHTVLLYGLQRAFGTHTLVAGIAVLVLSSVALLSVWRALREVATEEGARQGALLVACTPAFLEFSCTAMDAVFLLWAATAMWLGFRAFRADRRTLDAVAAGVLLCVASFASYSALPLGLFIGLYGIVRLRKQAIPVLIVIGASFALSCAALYLACDYSLWRDFQGALERDRVMMGRIKASRVHTDPARVSYGNIVAFLIAAGAPLVAMLSYRVWRYGVRKHAIQLAAVVTLSVLALGGLHHLETERIWLYAVPWLAGMAVCDGAVDDRTLRVSIAVSLGQSFAMEVLLFNLW